MSKFFKNFPLINYRFGDEIDVTAFQNISVYIDLIDQIADDISFYTTHTINDGDRPDTLSHKLYGTQDYYWTFYLLNEKIRQQGWPITTQEVFSLAKEYYPNTTLITEETMHGEFYKDDICATTPFVNPMFKGKILEKNYDLGQLIVKPIREVRSITVNDGGSGYTSVPDVTFTGGGGKGAVAQVILDSDTVGQIIVLDGGDDYDTAPTITVGLPDLARGTRATAIANLSTNMIANNTVIYSQKDQPDTTLWDDEEIRILRVKTVVEQYISAHHYEDSNGEWVDLDFLSSPELAAGKTFDFSNTSLASKTEVTHLERLEKQNDQLKQIKILKPEVAAQVVYQFNQLLKS